MRSRTSRTLVLAGAVTVLTLSRGAAAGSAMPRISGTLTYLNSSAAQPASAVLLGNFQRVYPDIQVNATYPPANVITPLLSTQIAAGNGPDVFRTTPGS